MAPKTSTVLHHPAHGRAQHNTPPRCFFPQQDFQLKKRRPGIWKKNLAHTQRYQIHPNTTLQPVPQKEQFPQQDTAAFSVPINHILVNIQYTMSIRKPVVPITEYKEPSNPTAPLGFASSIVNGNTADGGIRSITYKAVFAAQLIDELDMARRALVVGEPQLTEITENKYVNAEKASSLSSEVESLKSQKATAADAFTQAVGPAEDDISHLNRLLEDELRASKSVSDTFAGKLRGVSSEAHGVNETARFRKVPVPVEVRKMEDVAGFDVSMFYEAAKRRREEAEHKVQQDQLLVEQQNQAQTEGLNHVHAQIPAELQPPQSPQQVQPPQSPQQVQPSQSPHPQSAAPAVSQPVPQHQEQYHAQPQDQYHPQQQDQYHSQQQVYQDPHPLQMQMQPQVQQQMQPQMQPDMQTQMQTHHPDLQQHSHNQEHYQPQDHYQHLEHQQQQMQQQMHSQIQPPQLQPQTQQHAQPHLQQHGLVSEPPMHMPDPTLEELSYAMDTDVSMAPSYAETYIPASHSTDQLPPMPQLDNSYMHSPAPQ
ncbi:hypothetical protein JCM33374_g2749 [Metschnikowia sp. JCM 33374]|nr:hypothetical protein JCM33374_g2749 [Metschnikowia sp. JCM 33374]